MEVIHARCAGLDIHQMTVVACLRFSSGGEIRRETRTFGTTTSELLKLADWLSEAGVTHAVMESTGVYWKPVWHILAEEFELVLANAMHVRNIPGRKSDVNDATWLADLLAHGLVRGSFVPPAPVLELRDLTRTRKQLVREIAQHTQRIQKVMEDANLKLTGIISDVLGVSGRAIIQALIAGETDPGKLAELPVGRIKATRAEFAEALRGRVTAHHRFMLRLHLSQIEALKTAVREVEARLGSALEPFRATIERLTTMPGVSETVARVIVAEIGFDMSRFPTSGHLISWAGLCPRMNESGGKRKSTRTRHGAPWLKATLVQAAWSASRSKESYLRAQFLRLKSRRGPKKAILAVAASMLTAAYHMLKDGSEYKDLGTNHFSRINRAKVAANLLRRLRDLGYGVNLANLGIQTNVLTATASC